ncbi:MAG: Nif3-like dinuclear metal center hexameric protein [Thermacetogeniaceae bacterium]|jgi:dinuclear metal center YbgI/SA1388 family protein
MPVVCQTVIGWLEEWAPPLLAEDGDNIGLQVGSRGTEIERVLVTLEVTTEVISEAVKEKAQLIVSHHPLIRDPLARLDYESFPASLAVRLVESRIHFYAAHTNMDAAPGGVNDLLAERLGLTGVSVLRPAPQEKLYKLAVFIPRGHEDEVRQAICNAGAGWIGNYDECTFQVGGTGTFRPLPGTHPFLGRIGVLERAEESRLETVVPETRLRAVIGAMLAAHPYEEVAYDLYPIKNQAPCKTGLGRVGRLPDPKPLRAFAEQVGDALGLQAVRLAGDPERPISAVALCGGGAMSLLKRAIEAGADVYVTGDVKHHDALNAIGQGIAVIDAGHHATEKIIVPAMAAYLTEKAAAAGAQLDVIVSQVNTDPFRSQRQEVGARLAGTEVRGKKSEVGEKQEQDSEASKENPASGFGKLLIYIDGASRGNPGNAAAGVVILDEQQKPVLERKKYLGKTTNNVAEYQALILALQEALDMGAVQVEVKTDSELLANQWNGEYRVQNPGLVPLMQQARRLAGRLQSCKVAHVPRERNKRADALANQAIDEHLKNPGSG